MIYREFTIGVFCKSLEFFFRLENTPSYLDWYCNKGSVQATISVFGISISSIGTNANNPQKTLIPVAAIFITHKVVSEPDK